MITDGLFMRKAVICPTVTAYDPHQYREQIEKIARFIERIHIDFMDGLFAKPMSPNLEQAWWPHSIRADLHLMYHRPDLFVDKAVGLEPHMVIVHAEAEGDFMKLAGALKPKSIKLGVALLKETQPEIIKSALGHIDHVLIFSGDLGHFGGHADLSLLDKVKKLKGWKPELEIGWDGGISDKNAADLVTGGVDVLNVGGFIQKSSEPEDAYAILERIIKDKHD